MKHQAATALEILRTDGEETAHLDNDVPVCTVENIQVMNDKRSYMHSCTECDAENNLITGKPDERPH